MQLYGHSLQHPPGSGELILIYESGFVPPKVEEGLFSLIFKTDPFIYQEEIDEDDIWEFANTVVHRRNIKYDEAELECFMRLVVPVYISNRSRVVGVNAEVKRSCGTQLQRRLDGISGCVMEPRDFQARCDLDRNGFITENIRIMKNVVCLLILISMVGLEFNVRGWRMQRFCI